MTKSSRIKKTAGWFVDWRPALRSVSAGTGAEINTLKYLMKILKNTKADPLSEDEQHAWLCMNPHERWTLAKEKYKWNDDFLSFQRKYHVITAYFFLIFGISLLLLSVLFGCQNPLSIINVLTTLIFSGVLLLWYAAAAWRVWQIDNQEVRPLKDWMRNPAAYLP